MTEDDVDDEHFLNLCGREHVPNWLETRQSRVWASKELPCLPVPSFQSDERPILLDTLAEDKKALVLLEKQVKDLRKKVVKLRVQLTPIRLAPPEILSRIFYYVASGDNAMAYAFNSSIPPIITVCKQWRKIAREASLWDTIPLAANARIRTLARVIVHPPPAKQTNDERLRAWLALSRAPLDIYQQDIYHMKLKLADWSALFDTPRPWKHFQCSSPELVRRFFTASLDLASMDTLHLKSFEDVFPRNLEMEFPKLREINLAGGWVPSALSHLKAPQIYSVTLDSVGLETHHTTYLSQNFKTVVELRLHCVEVDHSINGVEISPLFPHLEDLSWTSEEGEYGLSVFQSSPQLHDLTITSVHVNTIHATGLQSVTNLCLSWDDTDEPMSEATARSLFTVVPQLSKLRIFNEEHSEDSWQDVSSALQALVHQNPMLCPKLQLLTLQYVRVPDPELLKTVSRLRSGDAIRPEGALTNSKEGDSSPPTALLVTLSWCRGPQDVTEANHEELSEALDEYYSSDELME